MQIKEIFLATAAQHSFATQIKESTLKRYDHLNPVAMKTIHETQNPLFWIENKSNFDYISSYSIEIMAIVAPAFDATRANLNDCPELTGSEKQISFAAPIRELFLSIYANAWQKLTAYYLDEVAGDDEALERWTATIDEIDSKLKQIACKSDAKFWIENRASLLGGWKNAERDILYIKT